MTEPSLPQFIDTTVQVAEFIGAAMITRGTIQHYFSEPTLIKKGEANALAAGFLFGGLLIAYSIDHFVDLGITPSLSHIKAISIGGVLAAAVQSFMMLLGRTQDNDM